MSYTLSVVFAILAFCVGAYICYAVPAVKIKERCSETCLGTVTQRSGDIVTVEYYVDGETYTAIGTIEDPDVGATTLYVAPVIVGDIIEVKYNPDKPKEGYVGEEPVHQVNVIFLVLMTMFISASGIFFHIGFRNLYRNKRKEGDIQ